MSKQMRFALCAAMAIVMVFAGGCGRRTSGKTGYPTQTFGTRNAANLSIGRHYIKHQEKNGGYFYFSPYTRDVAADSHPFTLWYHTDWGAVPTLYAGDQLVYKTDTALPDKFTFTRYQFEGYTFGFCGVKKDNAGRFFINTDDIKWISNESSANKLARLKRPVTVLHSIDGIDDLQDGNFSIGGTVSGLTPNAEYNCEFYTGSIRYEFGLKADTVALSSWETVNSYKCTYAENDVVEIELPAGLQSGYYSCNGSGLFRYVNGTSYNPETEDFNVPNAPSLLISAAKKQASEGVEQMFENEDHIRTYAFSVTTENPTQIKITYTDTNSDKVLDDPVVRVIGDDSTRTMTKAEGENLFDEALDLPIGSYKIEIEGLMDRTASVSVS